MSAWLDVEKLLIARVNDAGYPIVMENQPAERVDQSALWVATYMLPVPTDELTKDARDQYNGIYQVSIYGQQNNGKAQLLGAVDNIVGLFSTSYEMNTGDTKLIIQNATPQNFTQEADFFRCDVRVNWFAIVNK